MACQCCDREASAGAISPLGARRKRVEGLQGHQGSRQRDSPSLQPLSQHWRGKGMR